MQIDYGISIRPTQHRLLTAMGISTCAVAALLAMLGLVVDMSGKALVPLVQPVEILNILIRNDTAEGPLPIPTLAPAEIKERQFTIAPVQSSLAADEPKPARDWQLLSEEAAQATIDEHFRQEEIRDSMWRQTYSTMFKPTGDTLALEEEPVISDLRFIPRIHVFGLGVTIGSCFIGLPLVGVPVEQRSTMIPLFVCAGDSG